MPSKLAEARWGRARTFAKAAAQMASRLRSSALDSSGALAPTDKSHTHDKYLSVLRSGIKVLIMLSAGITCMHQPTPDHGFPAPCNAHPGHCFHAPCDVVQHADSIIRTLGAKSKAAEAARAAAAAMSSGSVVTEVTDEAQLESLEFWEQGDASLATEEKMRERQALRFDRRVLEVLQAFWEAAQRSLQSGGDVYGDTLHREGQYAWQHVSNTAIDRMNTIVAAAVPPWLLALLLLLKLHAPPS